MSEKLTETQFCPCCGRPNTIRQSPEWLLMHFSGIVGNVLSLLIECRREKRTASMREMCQVSYPDDDEFPIMAHQTVNAAIIRARPRLHNLGWDIVGPHTTGTGFCLVPLEPQRY